MKADTYPFQKILHMRKDDLKINSNDKMRLHYRKKSGKNGANSKTKTSFSEPTAHHEIELDHATEDEKEMYDDLFEFDESEENVFAGTRNRRGKTVIIDPSFEKKRKVSRKIEKIITFSLVVIVTVLVAVIALAFLADSPKGQKLINSITGYKNITKDGNFDFGSFDGYVTIGTSFDEATKILGLPTPGSDGQYFYNNSYILVENDIVVGYHKDRSDSFRVTVGYRTPDADPTISIGDGAKRVVSKLGSPDTYHKYEWIYENMNRNFLQNSYYTSDTADLIITFNDKYEVIGYEFVEQ